MSSPVPPVSPSCLRGLDFLLERKAKCARGHVTGQARNRGNSELGVGVTVISSRSSDLAKLNLLCHMNYSII